MDPRPLEHLTDDQIRAINAVRSYESALRITLRSNLSAGGETSPEPPRVREVLKTLQAWADEAVSTLIRHPRP